MRMQKWTGKRYCVFAKRRNRNEWTDWTQTNDIDVAMKQVEKIRGLGFFGEVSR